MMSVKKTNAMNWKSILSASWLILLPLSSLLAQHRYEGIKDPPSVNPYRKNYDEDLLKESIEEIKNAIALGFPNMDLFEYSLVIEELQSSFQNKGFQEDWKAYMDSLETAAAGGLAASGLIPLQARFFHATLEANPGYKERFPEAYAFLRGHTPRMEGMGYRPSEYAEVLGRYGFSDIVGEGIIMDFLMLEDVRLLEVIAGDAPLRDSYLRWVDNLGDPANEFSFSEKRPLLMLTQKKQYLLGKLRESDHPLAEITWPPFGNIMITRIRDPAPDSFTVALTGTWEGTYDAKGRRIRIYLTPYSNREGEDSIKGHNKFVFQSDIKQIKMKGTFRDSAHHYHISMEEYKVPFEKEPHWKRDVINEHWGGPGKFYPHDLSYGLFDVMIDKGTMEMSGTWSSKSGKIVREFTIPKVGD